MDLRANGYPYGSVTDTSGSGGSTSASIVFKKKGTTKVVRTLLLTKVAGDSCWYYSTAITAGITYTVTATNLNTTTQDSRDVTVAANQAVLADFVAKHPAAAGADSLHEAVVAHIASRLGKVIESLQDQHPRYFQRLGVLTLELDDH